jgi:5'-nucleotidase
VADRTPHLLVTNDDGLDATGIQVLREGLLGIGARVTVIAPAVDHSGVARAISYGKTVRVSRAGGASDAPVFACQGTPVDCVRLGVLSELVPPVDIVIAGINHGLNIGDDWWYSGTVGAAIEGALLGLPAIAISQQSATGEFPFDDRGLPVRFPHVELASRLASTLAVHPPPTGVAVNVNLPSNPDPGPEIELVRPGRRFYQRASISPSDGSIAGGGLAFRLYADQDGPPYEAATGTDFAALSKGHVAVGLLPREFDGLAIAAEGQEWFGAFTAAAASAT